MYQKNVPFINASEKCVNLTLFMGLVTTQLKTHLLQCNSLNLDVFLLTYLTCFKLFIRHYILIFQLIIVALSLGLNFLYRRPKQFHEIRRKSLLISDNSSGAKLYQEPVQHNV